MLVIRLKRVGKKSHPEYRMVVASKSAPVKGGYIERVGYFHPKTKELRLEKEKIEAWLKKGARPSNSVAKLLKEQKVELPKWAEIKVFPERASKADLKKEAAPAPAAGAPAVAATEAAPAETPAPEAAPAAEEVTTEEVKEEPKKEEK